MLNQEELCDGIINALRQITRAIDMRSKKLSQVYGLTGPQALLLKEIAKMGRTPLSVLARKINLSSATVSSIVDRLSSRGYIVRTRSESDKRITYIEITDMGAQVIKAAPSVLQESFVEELQKLELWEQALIFSTLARIADMMGAEDKKLKPVLGE